MRDWDDAEGTRLASGANQLDGGLCTNVEASAQRPARACLRASQGASCGWPFRWADSSRALVRTQPPPRGIQCWLAAWAGSRAGTGLVAQEEAQEAAQEQRLVCGVRPLRVAPRETTPTGPPRPPLSPTYGKVQLWVLGTDRNRASNNYTVSCVLSEMF